MEIDQARLMVLHAAWKMDTEGKRAARQEISMIKVIAAQMHQRVLDRAMQVHGALGMSDDTPLAAAWRQGRWLRIADGPDEVHKMVIALRELNRFKPREPAVAEAAGGARRHRRHPKLSVAATQTADRGLTDEQRDFVAAIRDFAAREKLERPEHDGHSHEIAARMGELGWYGLQIPEEYGGSGGSFLDATLFLEEFTRGQIPVAGYGVTLIVVGALNRFGTEEQKRDLFGRVVKGGTLAIAMSEPDAGSDVAALKTRARLEDGEWVLDGAKMWCSYAHKASHILIVCRTGPGERHEDMSMILVPRDAPGMTITPIPTLGGEETNEIHLDGVRVPEDALLGTEGGGWTQLMAGLNYERTILAATSLGLAQRAFDDALAYAKERRQFGRPVGLVPGDLAPLRRARHGDRAGAAAGALGGLADRRGPEPDAAAGGVDGEARGLGAGEARARSRASRSWAATATRRSTPWSGTSVRPW